MYFFQLFGIRAAVIYTGSLRSYLNEALKFYFLIYEILKASLRKIVQIHFNILCMQELSFKAENDFRVNT